MRTLGILADEPERAPKTSGSVRDSGQRPDDLEYLQQNDADGGYHHPDDDIGSPLSLLFFHAPKIS